MVLPLQTRTPFKMFRIMSNQASVIEDNYVKMYLVLSVRKICIIQLLICSILNQKPAKTIRLGVRCYTEREERALPAELLVLNL